MDVEGELARAVQGFQNVHGAIRAEKEQVEEDRRALEEEKAAMMTLGISQNDLIELSVGGQRITTKRSTLCQAEGSMLAAMFSGRWEDRMETDSSGAIFLDVNTFCMAEAIDYLRRKRLAPPEREVALPKIPSEREDDWEVFLDFFSLREYIYGVSIPYNFDCLSSGLVCENGVVRYAVEDGHKYAICSTPLNEITTWRVKLCVTGGWVFIGVIGNLTPPSNSHQDGTAYGWGVNSQVWLGGGCNPHHYGGWNQTFLDGDEVIMRFNMDAWQLQMRHLRVSGSYAIDLPRHITTWYLHLNLVNLHSRVEVCTATRRDVKLAAF